MNEFLIIDILFLLVLSGFSFLYYHLMLRLVNILEADEIRSAIPYTQIPPPPLMPDDWNNKWDSDSDNLSFNQKRF